MNVWEGKECAGTDGDIEKVKKETTVGHKPARTCAGRVSNGIDILGVIINRET